MVKNAVNIGLTMLASLLCGCAGKPSAIQSAPVTTVTARVLATEEVTTFVGDVAEVAYAHTLEPIGSPEATIVAISWERCPVADDREQQYTLMLERRPIATGLNASQDAALASGVAILSCKAVSSSVTSSLNDASPPTERSIIARLIRSGYVRQNGAYLYGPEDSDQVWAEWIYQTCGRERSRQRYTRRLLVHSIRFPRSGRLYSLSLSQNGEIQDVTAISSSESSVC